MLKLPKNTLLLPHHAAILEYFTAGQRPLREASPVTVSAWKVTPTLSQAMRRAAAGQHLLRGLDAISDFLAREGKGLRLVQEKSGQPEAQRLSRLLLLSSDGASRFYRDAEALLTAHGNRTRGVVLALSADDLGALVTAKGSPVKAVLIADRQALELFLAELLAPVAAP